MSGQSKRPEPEFEILDENNQPVWHDAPMKSGSHVPPQLVIVTTITFVLLTIIVVALKLFL